MEILITITNFLILGLLIILPFALLKIANRLKIKRSMIFYAVVGITLSSLLVFLFAWWSHESCLIQLEHYGYNIDGMSKSEFYAKVLPENMDKVKSLEISIMGIGWPLKAIIGFVIIIPYLIIVYIVKNMIDKFKEKKYVT